MGRGGHRFLRAETLVLVCLLAVWVFKSELDAAKAEALRQVVKTDRDTLSTYRFLASHYRLARPGQAAKACEGAPGSGPADAEAWVELGDAYWELGQHQTALDAYHRAATLQPDWAWPHLALAVAYRDLQRYEEAIEAHRRVVALHPDLPGLHVLLGELQADTGRWSEGLVAYKQAIALQPGNASARLRLAKAYLQRGHTELALQEYEALTALGWDIPSVSAGTAAIVQEPSERRPTRAHPQGR